MAAWRQRELHPLLRRLGIEAETPQRAELIFFIQNVANFFLGYTIWDVHLPEREVLRGYVEIQLSLDDLLELTNCVCRLDVDWESSWIGFDHAV